MRRQARISAGRTRTRGHVTHWRGARGHVTHGWLHLGGASVELKWYKRGHKPFLRLSVFIVLYYWKGTNKGYSSLYTNGLHLLITSILRAASTLRSYQGHGLPQPLRTHRSRLRWPCPNHGIFAAGILAAPIRIHAASTGITCTDMRSEQCDPTRIARPNLTLHAIVTFP